MMKRIFLLLLLALATSAHAAFVAQNGIISSNGVNVATGVISGNASGVTNVPNVPGGQTNSAAVLAVPNTNYIFASGFSVAGVNGSTVDVSAFNGFNFWSSARHAYTNSSGYGTYFDSGSQAYFTTNAAHHGAEYLVSGGLISGPYTNGAAFGDFDDGIPSGGVSWGTNWVNPNLSFQVNDASQLTNGPGSNVLTSYSVRFKELYGSWMLENGGPGRTLSLNRYKMPHAVSKVATGQKLRVMLAGTGLLDESFAYMRSVATNSLTWGGDNLYLLAGAGAHNINLGGAASEVYDQTVYFKRFYRLTASGDSLSVFTNSVAGCAANVFAVYYRKQSGGGNFKIQTNNLTATGAWGDVPGFTSIATANGSDAGAVARWTNAVVSSTQVRALWVSGSVDILDALSEDSTKAGVVMLEYGAQASAATTLALTPTNIWVPIFQDQNPDVVTFNFNENGGSAGISNFVSSTLTNFTHYLPNCDIMYMSSYPCAFMVDPYDLDHENYAERTNAQQSGWVFMDSYTISAPDWNTNALQAAGLMHDGIHREAAGYVVWASQWWTFMGLTNLSASGPPNGWFVGSGATLSGTGAGTLYFENSTGTSTNAGYNGTDFFGSGGGLTNVGFNAVTKTSNFTIPSTWVEATISNAGASVDTTNTLPPAVPGKQFTIVGEASHFIAVKIQGGDVIHNYASGSSTVAFTDANAVKYANFRVKCSTAGVWYVENNNNLTIGTQ